MRWRTTTGWMRSDEVLEIASDIVVMLAVVGTLMYIVIRVMESLNASETRHSDLANVIPVAARELDVSAVMDRLAELTAGGSISEEADADGRARYNELIGMVRISFSNETADQLADDIGKWHERPMRADRCGLKPTRCGSGRCSATCCRTPTVTGVQRTHDRCGDGSECSL